MKRERREIRDEEEKRVNMKVKKEEGTKWKKKAKGSE